MMVQFNEWFDENIKLSPVRNLFISWLEKRGIQGICDAAFEPETLSEEWTGFLFHVSRTLDNEHREAMERIRQYQGSAEVSALLRNSIEIGETSKGELYIKSIKRYHGSWEEDWRYALRQVFAMYDEARKEINARK